MLSLRCGPKTYCDIQAVLFDKDGTLADSAPYLVQLGRQRAQAVEAIAAGTEADLLRAFGFVAGGLNPAGMLAVSSRQETTTAAATYIAATGRDWHEAVAIAHRAFQTADQNMPRKAETTRLFPEARPLLETLHQRGAKLGIISADITPNIDDFVDCHQLGALIDITWGNDKPVAKPSPAAYAAVCKNLGVLPENTLMVGDAEGDMSMAKGAGAAGAIGVLWGWAGLENIAGADQLLQHWHELEVV